MTGGQALGLTVLPGASLHGVLTPLGLSLDSCPRECTAGLEAPRVPYDLSLRALRYDALVVLLPGRESPAVLKGLLGFFQASVGATAACALCDSPGPQPTLRVSERGTGLQMHPVHPPHAGTGGTSRPAHTHPGYGMRSTVARPAGKCVDSGCSVTASSSCSAGASTSASSPAGACPVAPGSASRPLRSASPSAAAALGTSPPPASAPGCPPGCCPRPAPSAEPLCHSRPRSPASNTPKPQDY